jgi:hypothetical protein
MAEKVAIQLIRIETSSKLDENHKLIGWGGGTVTEQNRSSHL